MEVFLKKICLFPDGAFSVELVRLSEKGEEAGPYILSGERVRAGGLLAPDRCTRRKGRRQEFLGESKPEMRLNGSFSDW